MTASRLDLEEAVDAARPVIEPEPGSHKAGWFDRWVREALVGGKRTEIRRSWRIVSDADGRVLGHAFEGDTREVMEDLAEITARTHGPCHVEDWEEEIEVPAGCGAGLVVAAERVVFYRSTYTESVFVEPSFRHSELFSVHALHPGVWRDDFGSRSFGLDFRPPVARLLWPRSHGWMADEAIAAALPDRLRDLPRDPRLDRVGDEARRAVSAGMVPVHPMLLALGESMLAKQDAKFMKLARAKLDEFKPRPERPAWQAPWPGGGRERKRSGVRKPGAIN